MTTAAGMEMTIGRRTRDAVSSLNSLFHDAPRVGYGDDARAAHDTMVTLTPMMTPMMMMSTAAVRFEKRGGAARGGVSSTSMTTTTTTMRAGVVARRTTTTRAGVMPVMGSGGATTTMTTTTLKTTTSKTTTGRRAAIAARAGGGAVEINPNDPPEEEVFDMTQDGQKRRWGMVIALFVAFVLCNLDKVNMSVAIVPMAQELGWTTTQKGLVGTFLLRRAIVFVIRAMTKNDDAGFVPARARSCD